MQGFLTFPLTLLLVILKFSKFYIYYIVLIVQCQDTYRILIDNYFMKVQFKYNLKKLREDKGLSQKELGDILGVSYSAVSAWELGRNEPDFDTLVKLSDFFNVDERTFLREKL